MTRSSLVVVLALAGLVAACAAPTPPTAPPPAQSARSAAPSTSPFPPRPAALPVSTVNPCQLLTPGEVANFGASPGQLYEDNATTGDDSCAFDSFTGAHDGPSRIVSTATKQSAAVGLKADGAELISVNGYGAVQAKPDVTSAPADCVVIVDVADGQALQAEYEAPSGSFDTACGQARDLATMALQNVRSR